jgi:hypothetical protein
MPGAKVLPAMLTARRLTNLSMPDAMAEKSKNKHRTIHLEQKTLLVMQMEQK